MQSTQVFHIAYCLTLYPEEADIHRHTCFKFVSSVLRIMPDIKREATKTTPYSSPGGQHPDIWAS